MTDDRPPTECVACGDPCKPGLRWCSNACFYAEDGGPDEDYPDDHYPDEEDDDDSET